MDRIGEGGGEAKKRKIKQNGYRRGAENGGDLDGRRKKRRQEVIGSLDVDPEDLENRKEAGREAQGAQGLSKNRREIVSLLSRPIRGFRNKYH